MPGKPVPAKRPWRKHDLDFLQQDTIRGLLSKFGPLGPLTIMAILDEAKKADLSGSRAPADQGILSVRLDGLASTLNADAESVAAIVRRAVDIGLLAYLPGTDEPAGRLVVRSTKRDGWEPRDGTAAARKARSRQEAEDDHIPL
jgi:hypothetical protein